MTAFAPVHCSSSTLLCAFIALGLCACGEQTFSSEACKDLPRYDVSLATKHGAVGKTPDAGYIENSPLSQAQQASLREAAAAGCITLPGDGLSLETPSPRETAPKAPAPDAGHSNADAGTGND